MSAPPAQRTEEHRSDGRAQHEALLRKHYSWHRSGFITETQEFGGAIAAFSSFTPAPLWNHGAWLGGSADEFKRFVESSVEWHFQHGRRPTLYLENPESAHLRALAEAGFEKFDEEAWMVHREGGKEKSSRAIEVRTDEDFGKFMQVFRGAFQATHDGYERALRGGGTKPRHFLLVDREVPVSAGTLMSDGTTACIYNLGTPLEHRGQGYGGELFRHLTGVAKEGGAETVFLQVENGSGAKRLYEKCGYRVIFIRHGFRARQWEAPRRMGTKLSRALGFGTGAEEGFGLFAHERRRLRAEPGRTLASATGLSIREVLAWAWAYLLHRYTGEDSVAFTRWIDSKLERCEIEVRREKSVRSWLGTAMRPTTNPEADESLLAAQADPSGLKGGARAFPIGLHVSGDGFDSLEIFYRTDLFEKDAIRRMSTHFATILESMAEGIDGPVAQVEIMSGLERRQLLVDWNLAAAPTTDRTLPELIEAQVERTPDAPALLLAEAGIAGAAGQMTYRQLNRRANRLAHRLRAAGVGAEVFVGICLERSLDMIVALLAVWKAGGAAIPLDPAYPMERLTFIVRDTRAPVVITERNLAPSFGRLKTGVILTDESGSGGGMETERNPGFSATPEHAAYVIYTSGSTGQPKGVVVTHRAIAHHAIDCREAYGISSRDRILQFSSFSFDAALEQILPGLLCGASLVVRGREIWSISDLEGKLKEWGITVADLPTAYWHQLTEEWSQREARAAHSLRLMIVGGEALSPEKVGMWRRLGMEEVRLINAYGPTEATITATACEISGYPVGGNLRPQLPIGRPRGGRKAYVVDRFGEPTPIGIPGELLIGGPLLARGYHNRPDLTAERFIANPFNDETGARLYRTGDLVRYLEDGNLEFLGRLDDQVKVRGFRVELGEVENALRNHAAIREAVVLAQEWAGQEKRLIAYFVADKPEVGSRELRDHLRKKLPDYMIPAAFVRLERLPLTPNGKLDRGGLPEPESEERPQEIRGPEDPLELQLQLLFERVLKRSAVGTDVNFFELGGDSLQALELLMEIEKATGKQLPLGTLFQSSTVQSLATELRQRGTQAEWSALVPLQTSGTNPPLFFLHTTPGDVLGYGNLVYRLGPNQPCYGFQSLGLNEAEGCHRSIEEMARFYTTLLRKFQAQGPYYLGGWCYGGLVAVEMARLLRGEGEQVAFLGLLETIAVPPGLRNWRYYAHRISCVGKMTPVRWVRYIRAKARYWREARRANRMRFREAEGAAKGESESKPRAARLKLLERVYHANLQALAAYQSRFYDGKVTLFNAADRDPALIPDPCYGWIGLAEEIEVYEVPGNHDTMLSEPNVGALAAEFLSSIERAVARGGSR